MCVCVCVCVCVHACLSVLECVCADDPNDLLNGDEDDDEICACEVI